MKQTVMRCPLRWAMALLLFVVMGLEAAMAQAQSPRKTTPLVVMLGDERTSQAGNWNKLLGWKGVQNAGVAGETLAETGARLNTILQRKPQAIYVMLGWQEVCAGASADEIFAACQTLIDRIWAHAATTKLYVLSLLPINERLTADKNLIDKSAVVAEVNQKLRHYCQTNHIAYINLFKQFVFHGTYTLQDALTTDGVHLTPMAYKRWAFFLKKFTATAEQS